ncbi:Cna B-type domain-containing protein [Scardovia wiggsiae]|uniref:Cna B-type domain-containing protein n=1 Tax=Scardovia wiggsiae TaxID=230143 RepID=UPI003BACF71C
MSPTGEKKQFSGLKHMSALAWGVLIALAMMLSLLPKTAASAAVISDNIVTKVSITDSKGNEATQLTPDPYSLNLDFKLPNNKIHTGDTSMVSLPEQLRFSTSSAFDVYSADGKVVAHAVIDSTLKKLVLTYTDYVEKNSDITGKITAAFVVDSAKVHTQTDIPFRIQVGETSIPVNGGKIHFTGPRGDHPQERLAKWGWVTDANTDAINYWVRINAIGETLKNVVLSDTAATPDMTFDPESFHIRKGRFIRNERNQWEIKDATDVTSSAKINFNADNTQFTISLGDVKGEGFLISYKAKIGHHPVDHEAFRNSASETAVGLNETQKSTNNFIWQSASGEANGYNYSVGVHKTDDNGAPLAGAVFKVVRDRSKEVVGTITTDASGNGRIGNLLRDDYTITEVTAPAGYQLDTTPIKVTADDLNNNAKAVVKNAVNTKLISVSGEKKWDDSNDQDGKRPAAITVDLLADGVKIQSKTVTAADGWKYSFGNLPESKGGKKIAYTVAEEPVDGYTSAVDGSNITNTHKVERTSVSVEKKWSDASNQDGVRPSSVSVQLYANGKVSGDPVTLDAANGWKHTWSDLDKNAAGKAIVYTVKEVSIPEGYTSEIAGDAASGYTITNKHTPGVTAVCGVKTWDDNDDQDGVRPKSITVDLLADGEKIQSKTVTAADGWRYSFEDLPQFKDGKKIIYTVSEQPVDGYKTTIDGTAITNTHKTEKTSVSVEKKWKDQDNKDGVRPSSVSVQLYADGKASGDPVTLDAANSWKHTWSGLDKNASGKAITYTVKETSVPHGYTSTISGDMASGFTVTNTHTPVVPPTPPVTPPTVPPAPKKPHLARTGTGLWAITIAGTALLAAGIILALRRKGGKEAYAG